MAEDRGAEGTDNSAETPVDVVDERTAVRLAYRPEPADTLAGLRVRGRIKRTGLLRWGFLALWVGHWLFSTVGRGVPTSSRRCCSCWSF